MGRGRGVDANTTPAACTRWRTRKSQTRWEGEENTIQEATPAGLPALGLFLHMGTFCRFTANKLSFALALSFGLFPLFLYWATSLQTKGSSSLTRTRQSPAGTSRTGFRTHQPFSGNVWHKTNLSGLALQHGPLRSHIRVLAAPLSVPLPATATEKQRKTVQCLDLCHPHWRPRWTSWLLASDCLCSVCCSHQESQPVKGRSLSPCLSLSLCYSSKQIK